MKSKFILVIVLIISLGILFFILIKKENNKLNFKKDRDDLIDNDSRPISQKSIIERTNISIDKNILMNKEKLSNGSYTTEDQLIKIAYERAIKGTNIPAGLVPQIKYNGDNAEIVWPIQWPKGTIFPRGSYHALVEINRKTGEIIKVLSSP